MERKLYISLPTLFGVGAGDSPFAYVKRFWPGLPTRMICGGNKEKAYSPENFPCSAQEMASYVAEVEAFSKELARGAGSAQALIEEKALAEKERLKSETDMVLRLGDVKGEQEQEEQALRQRKVKAQRLLCWFWQQEKVLAEISTLVGSVNSGTEQIGSGIGAESDPSFGLMADGVDSLLSDAEAELSPDWRICLASLLEFVPEGTSFVAEGNMARELQERFFFAPDSELNEQIGADSSVQLSQALLFTKNVLGEKLALGLPETISIVIAEGR